MSPVNGDVVYAVLTSSAACASPMGVQSANATVTVYPLPAAPVITQSSDSLYSSYSSGNQWYITTTGMIPGASEYYYVPAANGDYYVVHVDGNGCISAPSQVINFFIDAIGEQHLSVSVYPNPTKNVINVVFDGQPEQRISLKVMNTLGETVYEIVPVSTHTIIDLGEFADGVYFLHMIVGDDVKTISIVKNK